jgi:TPR repeat protein
VTAATAAAAAGAVDRGMKRATCLAAACLVAVLGSVHDAGAATDRIAVVVGNQEYDAISDLQNAATDARAMAELLREMGFTVFDAYDVDREAFEQLMRQSVLNADEGAQIVFFYAGHGIQIGRRNYLLPSDVAFSSVYDLPVESITLDRVIDVLSARGNVQLAIIDSCRENPFPQTMLAGDLDASLYETREGFEIFRTPRNSLVAFSTTPGQVAYDGVPGGHSPYTAAMIEEILGTPTENVTDVLARVRERVYLATDGRQLPWESSTLVQPFRFRDEQTVLVAEEVTETPVAPDAPALPAAVTLQVEYDRAIALGPALLEALGLPELPRFSLVAGASPVEGTVALTETGPVYAPTLSERPSDTTEMMLTESFSLGTAGGGEVSVTLEMGVNACDLAAGDALDPDGVGFFRLPNELPVAQALQLCEAAVAARPDEPRLRYQLGRAQQAATRFEEAFASFEAAAAAGHVRARNAVARLLTASEIDRQLTPIPEDRPRANALLEEGIAAADPFAMHSLGRYLLREGETEADRERGFELLERAAELGHTYSMNALGIYFLTPETAHFIPERGLRYLQASAARGDIYGFDNMGFITSAGLVGDADFAAAYDWYVRAALGGHPRAPTSLGRMIVRGQVNADPSEAIRWYDLGLERGDPWSGVNAAAVILSGAVPGYSEADALVRATKAFNLPGNSEAISRAEALIRATADDTLGRAIQTLLNELGTNVAVDGAIGPATRGAIAALAADAGVPEPSGSLGDVLIGVGLIYRARNPIRSDVF